MIGGLLLLVYSLFLLSLNLKLVKFFAADKAIYDFFTQGVILLLILVCMFLFTLTVARKQTIKILFGVEPTTETGTQPTDHSTVIIDGQEVHIQDVTQPNKPQLDSSGCYLIDMDCSSSETETLLYLIFTVIVLVIILAVVMAYKFNKIFRRTVLVQV